MYAKFTMYMFRPPAKKMGPLSLLYNTHKFRIAIYIYLAFLDRLYVAINLSIGIGILGILGFLAATPGASIAVYAHTL